MSRTVITLKAIDSPPFGLIVHSYFVRQVAKPSATTSVATTKRLI